MIGSRAALIKMGSAALFFGFWSNLLTIACAQTITVTPGRVLVDETTAIRAVGLKAGEHVLLRGELVDGDGKTWRSEAEFLADDQGVIDLTKQAPAKGSYRNISAMGLIWSMRPVTKNTHIYRPPPSFGQQPIRFSLVCDGKVVSSAELQQIAIANGVKQIRVEGQLHGDLFVPDKAEKSPGVLVLGGSEGGAPLRKAAWLASHGYAAFALAYFHVQGLPEILHNIPLEYFGEALNWMAQRPEIDKEHIGVMGTSRGGELALQLGSLYLMVHAVVAYVPANVRYPACCNGTNGAAWTWKGLPVAYAMPGRGGAMPVSTPGSEIHVETTSGPILLISGQDDGIWPSSEMTSAVVGRLRASHFPYPVERLDYPHAGHRAGLPDIIPAWTSAVPNFGAHLENFGGTPEGNAASSLDAGPKVLEFLQRSLGGEPATDRTPAKAPTQNSPPPDPN